MTDQSDNIKIQNTYTNNTINKMEKTWTDWAKLFVMHITTKN